MSYLIFLCDLHLSFRDHSNCIILFLTLQNKLNITKINYKLYIIMYTENLYIYSCMCVCSVVHCVNLSIK